MDDEDGGPAREPAGPLAEALQAWWRAELLREALRRRPRADTASERTEANHDSR